ncbi:selenide, water dikinase SelD [Baekduia soli]|uniref:Selenide, water dikinase n=1 Tax=Baekduia soli TaxID=496014 RepID=A0A5B8U8P7_9ACTN|nr:selenide, water dikinase SelD [Baekduia soli]QEC49327.1 selenide, water dikinase SelD [Baekduia soli]
MTAPLPTPAPLTSLASGAGCGCKLAAADLLPIVAGLPAATDARLLVGTPTGDDAGVFRLSDDLALVQTLDFFTPLVDDPYDFGRIAAANALSDVYAMGGTPLTAMNIVAFPLEQQGGDVLAAILRGGLDVVTEAGASIVGGHSIRDDEPKYGLAVTGTVHPDRMLTNAGGREGDALVLTKPLGVGAIVTAAKRGAAGPGLVQAAVAVMVTLNARAALAALAAGAHAMTDVTGFGLLGHLHNVARESGLAAEVEARAVPAIEGVAELLADAVGVSGGSRRNAEWAEGFATFAEGVAPWQRRLVTDATTSGGLLVAVAPGDAATVPGPVVGHLVAGTPGTIRVV